MPKELRDPFFDPSTLLGALVYGLICFGLAFVAAHLLRLWMRRIASHPESFIDKTAATFIAQLLRIMCYLIAVLAYAHVVPVLRQLTTPLLASAGVISLVVGLAAQNTLGQLIAGIAILFYRPFELDDEITLLTASGKEETGVVKSFSLGYTRLLDKDGRFIVVPNSVMLSSVLINATSQAAQAQEAEQDVSAAPAQHV